MSDNKPNIKKPNANLNITLSKEHLNDILKNILGPNGNKLNDAAIGSGSCCVDASVGSSVAGPVSSVASSVSLPADKTLGNANKAAHIETELQHTLNEEHTNINVQVPKDVKIS